MVSGTPGVFFEQTSVLNALILMIFGNLYISWVAFGSPKGQVVVATLDSWIRGTPPGLCDAGNMLP